MITDSPYRTREFILRPVEGAAAGVAGSLLMFLLMALLSSPHLARGRGDLLLRIGAAIAPRSVGGRPDVLMWVSAALFVVVGALLGLLYAACQDRTAPPDLFAVGIFYGIATWASSRAIANWFFRATLAPALRSHPWFLACLLYGVFLAACAAWLDHRRPKHPAAIPLD